MGRATMRGQVFAPLVSLLSLVLLIIQSGDAQKIFVDNIEFRSYDGYGVRPDNLGIANGPIPRLSTAPRDIENTNTNAKLGPSYTDGADKMFTSPNPRDVSNRLFKAIDTQVSNKLSVLHNTFGQFVSMDLIQIDYSDERADISVPKGDPFFDPEAKGTRKIPFRRANYFKDSSSSARQYINRQSSFLDLSHVYGTNEQQVARIRSFKDGKLLIDANNTKQLLPVLDDIKANVNVWKSPNKNTTSDDNLSFFFANNRRVNQDLTLIAWHTIFVLYHNYLCDQLIAQNFNNSNVAWSEERLFQEARRWNIAIYQNIVFIEYIPAINGVPLVAFRSYTSEFKPLFSLTHAFGILPVSHVNVRSLVPNRRFRVTPAQNGNLLLRDTYYSPSIITDNSTIEELLLGQYMEGQRVIPDSGPSFVDDIRNFLPVEQLQSVDASYTPTGDLCAIMIQRGRDLGLPLIPAFRITKDEVGNDTLAKILSTAYGGGDVDYISMLIFQYAALKGGEFGRLSDLFRDLRDSDKFYYEVQQYSRFTDSQIDQIRGTRVTTVISELVSTAMKPQFTKQLQGFFTPGRAGINDNPTDIKSDDTFAQPDGKFSANLLITNDYKVSWNLSSDLTSITLKLSARFSSAGWWALGFEPDPTGANKMVNMDPYLCKVESGSITVSDLNSQDVGVPGPDDGSDDYHNDARTIEVGQSDGQSFCTFSRPIANRDPAPIDKAIPLNRSAMVVWAYNPADIAFNYHGPTRGYRYVDFTTRKFNLTFIIDKTSNPERFLQIAAITNATLTLLNRNGGVLLPQTTILSTLENSNSDSGTAVKLVLQRKQYDPFVYNNKTIAFIGDEASPVTTAVQLVTRTIKVPQVNPFNRVQGLIQSDWDYFYRTIPTYSSQIKIIQRIIQTYGWTKVVGLFSNDQYSPSSIKDEFQFWEVSIISTASEIGRSLSDLKTTRVRVIVLWVDAPWVIPVLQTAISYGMTGEGYVWICADSVYETILSNPTIYTQLKGNMKGFITLTPSRVVGNPTYPDGTSYNDLLRELRNIYTFPTSLDNGSPFFYTESLYVADTIYAIAMAAKQQIDRGIDPTDGQSLNNFLKFTNFSGMTGHVSFDQNRERSKFWYEVWNSDVNGNFQLREIIPLNTTGILIDMIETKSNITFGDGTIYSPPDYVPLTPPEIVWVHWSDGVAIAAVIIASVMICLFIGVFVMLIRYQGHKVIRASSPIFLFTTLTGVVTAFVCVYVFTAKPTSFVCNLRPWLVSISFALIFGSLLVKTYRIVRILGTLDWARIGKLSTNTLLVYMGMISAVYLIILIVWMAYDPLYVRDDGENANVNQLSKICDSSHRLVFEGVLYGYSGVLLLCAAAIAFKSRHVKSEYGEAQWIALTLYNIVIAGVVIIPVAYSVKDPVAVYAVIVYGIMWAATATGIFFFLPKFFLIFRGTGSSSSAGQTPGGGSGSGSGSGSGTGAAGYNHNL